MLLDCGATALASLKREGIRCARIGTILISHFHGDHFSGVPFLLLDGVHVEARTSPLVIAGPPGVREKVEELYRASYRDAAAKPLPFDVKYAEMRQGESFRFGDAAVEPFSVPHQETEVSFAFRITLGGKRIFYTGDTGWTEELVAYAGETDLFICECSFFDTRTPTHLDYRRIVENRSRFDTRRLVLTHLGAEVLARQSEIELELACDGQLLEI